ncbi:MAG: OmpA family protein [Bacteroidetes bacterium]|jgi:chemotaxis protein MotB|nr:OmpA family protein [Bacteroidota bacterium]MDC3269420.1 OmpA family protein [Flavobacteriaceae bacterium]MDC3326597.1 OmpA family protein [Flavobacteriaceae bacterium]|tara:strand:+ start:37754 stop:38713 length:960 start_codon:yes stop_codon:yes gene_type:complete
MLNKFFLIITTLVLTISCVSPKVYKNLETKYSNVKKEYDLLSEDYGKLQNTLAGLEKSLAGLQADYDKTLQQRNKFQNDFDVLKVSYDNLKASYDALEQNSTKAIAENSRKNRELLAQLEAKEQALASESMRLNTLEKELEARSNRIVELERVIAMKDKAMTNLKNAITKALTDFEGKGLTIEQRDGKVYVSMENKLLFRSGSWAVGSQGRQAVEQLGKVLADNPDIAILIEGHTDNVPYKGNSQLSGNWDLSTKRATAIVNILRENLNIYPENLTAAGRGEYAPIASNDTAEGKAKNRRIEVVLTPKLDELSRLLNEK